MKLKFDNYENNELLYIELSGRGIRDMDSVSDGFLILAGPVGDGDATYQLYHWNGKDIIPGKDRKAVDIGRIRLLEEIDPPQDGKAEGVVVMKEKISSYQLIIAYDSVMNKKKILQNFCISKPDH